MFSAVTLTEVAVFPQAGIYVTWLPLKHTEYNVSEACGLCSHIRAAAQWIDYPVSATCMGA